MDALDKLLKETQAGLGMFLGVMLGFLAMAAFNNESANDGFGFVIGFFLFMGFGFMIGSFIPKNK